MVNITKKQNSVHANFNRSRIDRTLALKLESRRMLEDFMSL